MPDITMCVNTKCPVREFCYRYRAKPSEYQSFSIFVTIERGSGFIQCDGFWDLREERRPVDSLELADNRNKETEEQIKALEQKE